jgi:hypothetical protein
MDDNNNDNNNDIDNNKNNNNIKRRKRKQTVIKNRQMHETFNRDQLDNDNSDYTNEREWIEENLFKYYDRLENTKEIK